MNVNGRIGSNMKIIVTGATGLLGRKIHNVLKRQHDVIGTCFTRKKSGFYNLDIRQINDLYHLFERENPDVVVHTAALVDADLCERDRKMARDINFEGTKNIALSCKFKNTKLIFISSDYCFDGNAGKIYREEFHLNPVNYYGETKANAEALIKEMLEDYVIVRPGILYGYNDEDDKMSFPKQTVEKLEKDEDIFLDNKVVKYPTLIDDVALAIKKIIEIETKGIYHVAGNEGVTRYNWGRIIADVFGYSTQNIFAKNEKYGTRKPLNVFLATRKIKELGVGISSIEEGTRISKQQRECIFRLLYSIRPGMEIMKEDIAEFRINVGKRLAREAPVEADIVVPIPETGIFPASGFAHESEIPLYHGLIRNNDVGRLLYEPSAVDRSEKIRAKLIPVNSLLKGKRVVLIDEAIITGITMEIVIKMLVRAEVKEIHIRIPSPPFISPCIAKQHPVGKLLARKFAVGTSRKERHSNIERGLKDFLAVDSVKCLSLESLIKALTESKQKKCVECFVNQDG